MMRNKGDWGVDVDISLLLVSGHFVSTICSGIMVIMYHKECSLIGDVCLEV